MKCWFDNRDRQDRLCAEARSWDGTRYKHYNAAKGVAVDCAHFVGMVLVAVGAMRCMPDLPWYPPDLWMHGDYDLITEWFTEFDEDGKEFVTLDERNVDDYKVGDVVGGYVRNTVSHLGLVINRYKIAHVLYRQGYCEMSYRSDEWLRCAAARFRLMEV